MLRKSLFGLSAASLLLLSGCHCCDWCKSACCHKRPAPCDPCCGPAVPPPPGGPGFVPAPPPVSANFGTSADVVVPAQRPAFYYGGSMYRPYNNGY